MSEPTKQERDAYVRAEQAMRRLEEWQKRASEHMPALAARVFALRGKCYPGCGYHYALEGRLGKMIRAVCDPTTTDFDNPKNPIWCQRMMLRVGFRQLVKDIWLAEHNGGKAWERRNL